MDRPKTEMTGRYMVVDISAGKMAPSYPVETATMLTAPVGGWGDEYRTAKLVLRWIPPGAFAMGSPPKEHGRDCDTDEMPHWVVLTKPFYIGIFEVTQKQWERVMGSRPSARRLPESHCDVRPVEQVSYCDIRGAAAGVRSSPNNEVDEVSFMGRLRARTAGMPFDLPTEAQWEYAGRAGTLTALNSGKNLTKVSFWSLSGECPAKFGLSHCRNMSLVGRYQYNDDAGHRAGWIRGDPSIPHEPAKVGSYLPNAWGLYDIHGNVAEWCLEGIARGGSWCDEAQSCRVGSRCMHRSDTRWMGLGFRVALPATQ